MKALTLCKPAVKLALIGVDSQDRLHVKALADITKLLILFWVVFLFFQHLKIELLETVSHVVILLKIADILLASAFFAIGVRL